MQVYAMRGTQSTWHVLCTCKADRHVVMTFAAHCRFENKFCCPTSWMSQSRWKAPSVGKWEIAYCFRGTQLTAR